MKGKENVVDRLFRMGRDNRCVLIGAVFEVLVGVVYEVVVCGICRFSFGLTNDG